MRRAGLWACVGTWVTSFACSGAPSPVVEREAEPVVETVEPAGPSTRVDDPLLASARGQMRRGRVPDSVREELLASRDPDHRRAARLLQAVAGETPAAGLSRVERVEPSPVEPTPPIEPTPSPSPSPSPEPTPTPAPIEPTPTDPIDDDRLDPPPKLDDVPRDSPLYAWLQAGTLPVEPPPAAIPIELPLERLIGPELLLLRERPPRPASASAEGGQEGGLVILTRVNLRDEGNIAWLVLAGSGPVGTVWMQPLDDRRIRFTIADAGAVPSFVSARPTIPAMAILDVARRDRDVEIELGLEPGWVLAEIERLDNGAAVGFSRSDTLPPS